MYVDAIWNKDKNTIDVVERVNGERRFVSYPTRYVVMWPSIRGKYTSIRGDALDKFETARWDEFQKELRMIPPEKRYESDINPIFRCFYDHYKNAPSPKLHVAFWDIEVDFHKDKGFSSPEEAFNPINAISVHCNWLDRCITLVTKPKGVNQSQAEDICNRFEDTLLCANEAELLDAFLTIVDDADVISGWNCLDLNSQIFTHDRIMTLEHIKSGYTLASGVTVKDTHRSGLKKKNILSTVYGHTINISDEHKIPVYVKKPHEFKNPNTLMQTEQDQDVASIKKLMIDHDVYVEINPHTNTNPDYTYRDFVLEYWDQIFDMGLDLVIEDNRLRENLQHTLGYKSTNYVLLLSMASNHVDKQTLIQYFTSKKHHRMMFNRKSRGFVVNIDQPIPVEDLQILGLIYTDGFYSNYDKHFSISNTNPGVHAKYKSILDKLGILGDWKIKSQDNCSYLVFKGSCRLGILMPMIYKKTSKYQKKLCVEMMSRLSTKQFAAFVSGLVDGDGSVTQSDVHVCNFNNDVESMSILLNWNGVFTTITNNHVRVPYVSINAPFLNHMDIGHDVKRNKFSHRSIQKSVNSPNKKLNKFIIDQNKVLVKLKSIEETNDFIQMGDIETSNHYFICNGIRVHNSSSYDIPYLHNRIVQVLSKEHTRRLCLWNKFPKKREYEMYGKTHVTYDLFGRVHLDYLDLYRKHTYHEMHSYRLDFVGETEVGEKKVAYEGSLDKLYNEDFERFIEYNRQDVMLLVKIDQKLKFIDLSNDLAHTNGVLLNTTLGSVLLIDNAITNEAHDLGYQIPARPPRDIRDEHTSEDPDEDSDGTPKGIVGAYVADPVQGMHDWIGGVDINSLYPSAIRSLNMSKETVVGQIRMDHTLKLIQMRMKEEKRSFADAWNEQFSTLEYAQMMRREQVILTVDLEDGGQVDMTGDQLYAWIFENPKRKLIVSANGTIFHADREGIVPGLLARWYGERKQLQARKKTVDKFIDGVEIPGELLAQVKTMLD